MAIADLHRDLNHRLMHGEGVSVTIPPDLVPVVQVLITITRGEDMEPWEHGYVWDNRGTWDRLYLQRYRDGWYHVVYQTMGICRGKYLELNRAIWQLVDQWTDEHRRVGVVETQWVPDLHEVYQFDNSDDPDWEVDA
jgi:hypothetical protein